MKIKGGKLFKKKPQPLNSSVITMLIQELLISNKSEFTEAEFGNFQSKNSQSFGVSKYTDILGSCCSCSEKMAATFGLPIYKMAVTKGVAFHKTSLHCVLYNTEW